jgi:endonuclease YncB( thermonuclease family)
LGADVSAVRQFRGAARGAVLATLLFVQIAPVAADEGCRFVTAGSTTVRTINTDGIVLADGRVVRLAGIEPGATPDLAAGTAVTLKHLGSETDRYGRLQAHVFVDDNGTQRWVQADLVARGIARVSSRVGDPTCAKILLGHENSARDARLGLWAEPVYVIGKAEDPAGVLESRGRFALVEGKVVSVRESGGTIYVNFGRRWSEDFTVTIAKRNERAFAAAGLVPKSLSGRRVRVRGWIEERGGPWVEAARPEQIEVLKH